jgi:FHA domain/TIR domain
MRMGKDWQRQIRAALARTDWFLVGLSPDAQKSEWVQAETHSALEHMPGRVVPLMARTCEPAEVRLRLGTIQYIDFRASPEESSRRLLALVTGDPSDTGIGPAADNSASGFERTLIIAAPRQTSVLFSIQPASGCRYEQRLHICNWAVIGRAEDVDLRILDDCVSRRHAKIAVGPSVGAPALALTDLDSANGTFINKVQLTGSHPLAVGDIIDIGNVRLHLLSIDGVGSDARRAAKPGDHPHCR